MPPMMRSRGQRTTPQVEVLPTGPSWQRTAPTFLHIADSVGPTVPWPSLLMNQIATATRDLVPPETVAPERRTP
eukprot:6994446-Lingulodinium_polyedra.AAC.1